VNNTLLQPHQLELKWWHVYSVDLVSAVLIICFWWSAHV